MKPSERIDQLRVQFEKVAREAAVKMAQEMAPSLSAEDFALDESTVSYGSTSAVELNELLERIGLGRVVTEGMDREQARQAIVADARVKGVM